MLPRLINRYQRIWFRPFRGPFTLEKRMNEPDHRPEPMVEIRSEIRFAVSATTRNNSPLMALSGHLTCTDECPLSGVKLTSLISALMCANDPYRTLSR